MSEQFHFEHDSDGLVKGIEYKYTPEGKIDWFSLIPEKFLYIESSDKDKVKEIEDKYGKSPKQLKPFEVDKKYLRILLDGIRYLAALRGFKIDDRKVDHVTYDERHQIVVATTITSKITWIPNLETRWEITTSDQGGASIGNTDAFMQRYIETAASNRAFIRNVRGFLNIGVVGKDEIGPAVVVKPEEESSGISSIKPEVLLEESIKKLNLSFNEFKKHAVKYFTEGLIKSDPSKWESYKDIPAGDVFELLKKANKKK